MDETSLTAWPDIAQREGAREQVAGRHAPRNGGYLISSSSRY
jgi:hypothetical protein